MLTKVSEKSGTLVPQIIGEDKFLAFVPHDLPKDIFFHVDQDLLDLLEKARGALGKLEGIASILPNPDLFQMMFMRMEALLSSQIEGTQSSLDDVLEAEVGVVKSLEEQEDWKEISNYLDGINLGLKLLKEIPISNRLLRDVHKVLLEESRGKNKRPGIFRTEQNRIGGTKFSNATFVPPPWESVETGMAALEKFINESTIPSLIKSGLAHYQFETIHPFLDGNGRLGRLLVTLMLCKDGVLRQPILYLSLYLKKNKTEYFDRLMGVRRDGNWEEWIKFYLRGIWETSEIAIDCAKDIIALHENHREKVRALGSKASANSLRLLELLFINPFVTTKWVSEMLKISLPAARDAIKRLRQLNFLSPLQKRGHSEVFAYDAYLTILYKGTADSSKAT